MHLSHSVDRRLIIEGDPPPADLVSLQLTRGVNNRLAPGKGRVADGDQTRGVAGHGVEMVPRDEKKGGGDVEGGVARLQATNCPQGGLGEREREKKVEKLLAVR